MIGLDIGDDFFIELIGFGGSGIEGIFEEGGCFRLVNVASFVVVDGFFSDVGLL